MKTFNKETKEKYLNRVKAHQAADKIVKGQYWQNGKGCAVGCTIEDSEHSRYETELGIPRAIARLEDRIFEGLPNELAMTFPARFLEAVPIDADLSLVVPKFFIWLLTDEKNGVVNFVGKYKKCVKAIKDVSKLYSQVVGGKEVKKEKWIKVKNAAYAAAAYAAAAAAYAADAAAYAATTAAAYAADAAYAAAAYAAAAAAYARRTARENHYVKMADKLIELIKECK